MGLRVDFAGPPATEPLVVRDDASTLVAIIDGSGSWGAGVETAAWARERWAARWQRPTRLSPTEIVIALLRELEDLPAELRDDWGGWSFSFTSALVHNRALTVIAAGRFGAAALRGGRATWLFRPRMMLDDLHEQLRARGHVTEEAREVYAKYADISTEPWVGDPRCIPSVSPPWHLERGDAIVLAPAILTIDTIDADLAAVPHERLTAAELQSRSGREGLPNVVLEQED